MGCEREECGVRLWMVKPSKMRGSDSKCQMADGCVVVLVAMLDSEMEISRIFYACFKFAGREGREGLQQVGRWTGEGKEMMYGMQVNKIFELHP